MTAHKTLVHAWFSQRFWDANEQHRYEADHELGGRAFYTHTAVYEVSGKTGRLDTTAPEDPYDDAKYVGLVDKTTQVAIAPGSKAAALPRVRHSPDEPIQPE